MNTSMNAYLAKQNRLPVSNKNKSKDRLLHSSFYLYKLTIKNNTPKAFYKRD